MSAPPVSGAITATIGNKSWASQSASGVLDGKILTITGVASNGSKFSISIGGDSVGTYPIHGVTLSEADYIDSGAVPPKHYDAEVDQSVGGTIHLTAFDTTSKLASGTFSFTMRNKLDDKQISVEDGVFTNINIHIASPDDDTTVFNYADLIGNLEFVTPSGTTSTPVNFHKGVVELLGSRIVCTNAFASAKTLRMEIEQHIAEGTVFYPTKTDNLEGSIQLIVSGKVYGNESGNVAIVKYDTLQKKMEGNLSIRFEKDSATNSYYKFDGAFKFTHP